MDELARRWTGRWLRGSGAVLAAASVALAAYASHAAGDAVRANLMTAAAFAFGHGLALAALARGALSRSAVLALGLLWLGSLLFCGSLAGKALLGTPSTLAPAGGICLILGWLLFAVATVRE